MERKGAAEAPLKHGAFPPATCPVVVVAASAGGLQALTDLLRSIPAGFTAAIAVVQHRSLQLPDLLVNVLRTRTTLHVKAARDGEPLEPATVHVCPAGMHMMVDRSMRLFQGERLNFVRPSADLMFVSMAHTYGRRAIGVVLSGMGTDGAIGSKAIVDVGGTVIAQEPASAQYPDMPSAAAAVGPAQLVLPPHEIGPALQLLLEQLELQGNDATVSGSSGRAPSPAATKVLLADDHRIVLEGLRVLLDGERDLVVLPLDAEDGYAAVRLSAELGPDVVVMDLAMPGQDGVVATRQIVSQNPAAKIIALSARTDARTTERALRAGASAVVSKQKAFYELPAAIRSVMAGHFYVSRQGHAAAETFRTNPPTRISGDAHKDVMARVRQSWKPIVPDHS